jgi:hypothetical protein
MQKLIAGPTFWGQRIINHRLLCADTGFIKNFNYHPELLKTWNAGGILGLIISYS